MLFSVVMSCQAEGLKMETASVSETSVSTYESTRKPEERHRHPHNHESLRSTRSLWWTHLVLRYFLLLLFSGHGLHNRGLSWGFKTNSSSTGWGCQPHAQPPTWRTRVSLFVWVITFDLSSVGAPACSYATAGIALRTLWPRQPCHSVKVGTHLAGLRCLLDHNKWQKGV
jgi:hypothetical protein